MSNLRTLRNPACGKLCQLEEGIVSGGGRNNLNDFRIAAVTSLISLGIRVELRERADLSYRNVHRRALVGQPNARCDRETASRNELSLDASVASLITSWWNTSSLDSTEVTRCTGTSVTFAVGSTHSRRTTSRISQGTLLQRTAYVFVPRTLCKWRHRLRDGFLGSSRTPNKHCTCSQRDHRNPSESQ